MKHPLQRRWMSAAFLVFRSLVRWLPFPVAQALGRCLGLAAYGLLGRYRRLTWMNLRLAFGPTLSTEICHRIARRVFVNLGKTAAEWCVLERCSPARLRRVVEVRGLSHLRQALAKGRGVICLSGHFGNWELLPMTLASLGFQGGVLARPLRYPEYQRFLWSMRAGKGVATYDRGALRDVSRVLRANQIIGVVPDQDVDGLEGVFVEFFDRPAYTPVGPAALALMTGASLIPCFSVRDGRRFRLVIEEPITIARTEDRAQDLLQITQAWSQIVESYIRRHPDHWAWMHRRWKTQPETRDQRQETGDDGSDELLRARQRGRRLQPAVSALCVVGLALCAAQPADSKSHESAQPPRQQAPAVSTETSSSSEESSGQQMDRFTMSGYASDGTKRWNLIGSGATLEGALVNIQRPNGTGFGQDRTAYLTASTARVDQNTRRVHMEHDVTIHTSDGFWLTSPTMYWLPDRNQMITEQPVRMETDHMLLRGRGATAQTQLKYTVVERDVELILNPKAEETSDGRSHVRITCDGPLSFDYEHNIATFEHNVHVVDPKGDLYSDRLIAYLDQATRTIRYAEALGRVRIVQGANTAHSSRAVYEPAHGKITLLGSPSLLVYPHAATGNHAFD